MTGAELAAKVAAMSDAELMQQAGEWIADSVSAHYECNGTAPPEGLGRKLCAELLVRAELIEMRKP